MRILIVCAVDESGKSAVTAERDACCLGSWNMQNAPIRTVEVHPRPALVSSCHTHNFTLPERRGNCAPTHTNWATRPGIKREKQAWQPLVRTEYSVWDPEFSTPICAQ